RAGPVAAPAWSRGGRGAGSGRPDTPRGRCGTRRSPRGARRARPSGSRRAARASPSPSTRAPDRGRSRRRDGGGGRASSLPLAPGLRAVMGIALELGGALRVLLGGERAAKALASASQDGARGDVADAHRGGELETREVVQLGEQEGGALALGDGCEGALEGPGKAEVHRDAFRGRGSATGLTGPRDHPNDLPAAQLVEGDAVGDLVEPRAGVLVLLERVV